MRIRLSVVFLVVLFLAACSQVAPSPRPEASDTSLAVAAQTYVYSSQWGTNGTNDGQLATPTAIASDSSSNIYTADFSSRIQKFDADGNFLSKWGARGSGDGQFNLVFGLASDNAGHIYLSDYDNHRIQKFTSDGTFITKWGSFGSGDGQFNAPTGITVDASNNVYVSDYRNHRIQKFTSDGNFITKWGTSGSGDGQFSSPIGITNDASGNVYVADTGNNRIQKFTTDGTFLAKWGTQGSGDGQFNLLAGIAVDSRGDVFAADGENDRIQKFTADGTFLTKWGSRGTGDGQFRQPYDVTVSSSGKVYVADRVNSRIQTFVLVKSNQTISFTSTPPDPATVGGSYQVSAESTSGLAVSITASPSSVCDLYARTVSFVGPGECVITASQAGNDEYEAATPVEQRFTVSPAPEPTPDTYTVDFEKAPINKILFSVKAGQGVVYSGTGTANKDPIRVDGYRYQGGKKLSGNQVKVISVSGDKVLTVVKQGTNTPNPTGGELDIKPAQSFGGPSQGKNGLVSLKSITINGVSTNGAKLILYGNGQPIKTISLAKTPSQTLVLNEPGVGFMQVRANDDFTVDDVVFEVAVRR